VRKLKVRVRDKPARAGAQVDEDEGLANHGLVDHDLVDHGLVDHGQWLRVSQRLSQRLRQRFR